MKSFIVNTILLGTGFIVALLLGEVILRVAGYGAGNPYDRLLNNNDVYVGYRMIPGDSESIDGPDGVYEVDIVSLGLFDDERGFRDDGLQGTAESLFFGDSFVWGFGVQIEDSVSEQYERLSGKDAVNLGMTAFTSPTQYYRLFRYYAPKLRADHAFFGFFLGNDFSDSIEFDRWLLSGKNISYPEWRTRDIRGVGGRSLTSRIRRNAYKHSVLWRFIADRVDFGLASGRRSGQEVYPIETDDLDLVLSANQILTSIGKNEELEVTLVRRALRGIVRTGELNRTRPFVFVIPTKELVYQSYFPDGTYEQTEDARYRVMLDLLDESGIDYIDLLPTFRKAVASGSQQLYFRQDGHWNAAGHALAARAIYDYMNSAPPP